MILGLNRQTLGRPIVLRLFVLFFGVMKMRDFQGEANTNFSCVCTFALATLLCFALTFVDRLVFLRLAKCAF